MFKYDNNSINLSHKKSLPKNGEAHIKKPFGFYLLASLRSHLLTDDVQCATCFKPFYLLCIIGMIYREAVS